MNNTKWRIVNEKECAEQMSNFPCKVQNSFMNKDTPKKETKTEVPVWHKCNLTIDEAAAYYGIGCNKLKELTNNERCPFVL